VKPLKSSRRAAAAAAEGAGEGAKPPTKRAKPTALKKQLVRERAERLQRFMREEILQPMVQRAMGIAPEPSVPSTPQEAQLQLAALSRRIKKANYEAKKVVHDQRQAEARASKIARIEESRRKRSEQQDAARLTKSQGQAAPLVAAQPGAVAEASVSSDNGAANGSDGVAASPQQLPDAAAAAAAHASSSQTGNNEIHNSSHNECETIEPGSLNQDDTYVAGEEKGDTTAVHGDSDANTSTESGSDAEGEDSESDSECEFVPAAPLPSSSHPLGHLPSATPPQPPPASDVTASSSSSSTSSSAPRLQMFRSQRIPSSLVLTAHEEALLRWHFQSEHHGVQPSLQGAVKRHCKQMFKAHINQQTVAILKELRRFSVRLKERDPKRAALRLTYVSGLKQTSKLLRVGSVRCVVVAANIEANEAAGGLDDLLDEVMDLCEERRVPIVFALDRAKLGHAVGLRNLTSSVAILDYSAVGDAFRQLLGAVSAAQEEWRMLQEDTLLNPRPDGWAEAHAADLAHIAARKAARAAALAAHESAYARAEAERKASLAAQQAAKGGKKKKKSSDSGGGGGGGGKGRSKRDRELLPLPTLSEEDAKRGRRKGRRGAKRKDQEGGAADAAAAGSGAAVSSGSGAKVATTAAQLKGAGRALSAIAEAMADEQKSAAGPGGGAAAKSAKKGGKQKDVAAPAPAPVVAEDSRSKKKGGGGKSDKKGGKGKSHK
jgi:ribosomal protein L7Ae-like RNA K-turn-binding protein